MTSNTKREEIINKVFFDEKKDLLKDMAKKNDEQIKKIKNQIPATIENLETDVDSMEMTDLQNNLRRLKAKESAIDKEIKYLRKLLDTVNGMNENKDTAKQQDLDIEHILSATSENEAGYNKLRNQFVKIGKLSKNIEQKINELNDE